MAKDRPKFKQTWKLLILPGSDSSVAPIDRGMGVKSNVQARVVSGHTGSTTNKCTSNSSTRGANDIFMDRQKSLLNPN